MSGRDLQIISAVGACRSAPLVVEEACLMCHSFPSVTCLNTHFQTLSLPGGIICCNVGVRNPGEVQLVIHSILVKKKKKKNRKPRILEMEMFSGKPVCCGRKNLIFSDQVGGWHDLVHKHMKRMKNW